MDLRHIAAFMLISVTHYIYINNVQADIIHKIQPGETLSSIAKRYGVTTDVLKALNPKTEKYVFTGMELTIPVDSETQNQNSEDTEIPRNNTLNESNVKQSKSSITKNNSAANADFFSIPEPEYIPLTDPIAEGGFFEGDLYYRAIENHSKSVIKWSSGLAYNGERNLRVVMRGSDLDIIDESLQYHTLLLPRQNKVYLYSDLLKRALEFDYSYTSFYLSSLSPNSNPASPNISRTNQIAYTDEIVEYNGDLCKKMKGDLIYNGPGHAHYKVEAWYSDRYSVYKSYWSVLQGLEAPGIVKKWVFTFSSESLPIVGHLYGSVASELLGVIERKVNDQEFSIPSNYSIIHNAQNKDVLALYKDQCKALDKHGCYPGKKDMRELDNNVLNDWDFVDEFIATAKQQNKATRMQLWMQVGMGLFQLGSQIAEITMGGEDENATAESGSSHGGSGNYQQRYDQMESKARDAYEHMMNTSGNTGTYTSFGKNMRYYQREMRKIRAEAKRNGITIKKSGMEDATSPGRSSKFVDRNWYGDV